MSLARNVFVQSAWTLTSRILGFARDALIFARLGAGPVNDAFITAQQFPNLFRRLLAEGAFAQAFVPLYSKTLSEEGDEAAASMASETLSMLFTTTIVLSAIAQLGMPWIMLLLQGGYRDNADIFQLSILLGQITMPYLVGMALSALFAGVLNSAGRFALSAAAPTVLNICLISAALYFSEPLEVAMACSAAIVLSGVLQALLLYWGVRRRGVNLTFRFPRITPAVKRVTKVAVPGAIAASATQINIIISSSIASYEAGAKSFLASADRLYQLPLGIVGVAVGVAILPRLSRAVSDTGDDEDGRRALDEGVGLSMALTIPAAVALGMIPVFLIDALFGRGAYTLEDAQMSARALIHFAWGVPAFVLVKVLSPGFFARQDTVTPMRFALVSVVFNTIVGAGAFFWLRSQGMPGFPGLAVATSLAAWVNVMLLAIGLVVKGYYRPGPVLWSRLARVFVSALLMGGLLWMARDYRAEIEALAFDSKLLGVLLIVAVGGLAYLIFAFLTGAIRLSDIRAGMRRSAKS